MKQMFKKKVKKSFSQKSRRYGYIKYASISLSQEGLYQNDLVPIDNVLHSLWSRCDITMNGEIISTTNQKYMCSNHILRLY